MGADLSAGPASSVQTVLNLDSARKGSRIEYRCLPSTPSMKH